LHRLSLLHVLLLLARNAHHFAQHASGLPLFLVNLRQYEVVSKHAAA
jgi:hypothetical protein